MLSKHLASVADEDRVALAGVLADAMPISVGLISAHALRHINARPRLALHIYMWLIENIERPQDATECDEWLKSHNNACYLAALHGTTEERRTVLAAATPLIAENPPIAHNAAAAYCRLGDAEGALEAVRLGVEAGLDVVAIAHMRDDADLDLIRGLEAFGTLVDREMATLPVWAKGWDIAAFNQFREDVRTTLPDPDLSRFDEGFVTAMDREFDIRELAKACADLEPGEGSLKVHRHFHRLLSH